VIVLQWSGVFAGLAPPSHHDGKSLRFRATSANPFPKKLESCTSRADRVSISDTPDGQPQNLLEW
jgi:hypothetical protein